MNDVIENYIKQIDGIQATIDAIPVETHWQEAAKKREKLVNEGYDLILAKHKEEARICDGKAKYKKLLSFTAPLYYFKRNTKGDPGKLYYSEQIKVATYGAITYTGKDGLVHTNGVMSNRQRCVVMDLLIIEKPDNTCELKCPITEEECKQAQRFSINIGRAVVSTFKGIPDDIKPEEYAKLDINFTSGSNNPSFSNVTWARRSESTIHVIAADEKPRHELDERIKPVLCTFIQGTRKGQQYVLAEGSQAIKNLGLKADSILAVARGNGNTAYHAKWEFLDKDKVDDHIPLTQDIADEMIERDSSWDPRITPSLGKVLFGEYAGYEFVLFGAKDMAAHGFSQSQVSRVLNGKMNSTGGCSFIKIPNDDKAREYPRGLTDEIKATL